MSFISRSGRHAAVLAGIVLAAASWPAAGVQASARGPAILFWNGGKWSVY